MHVVAAALINDAGEVLLQRRAHDAHQGGLWEFPGGKLEPGEQRWAGLKRELTEELGITVTAGRPLIGVRHDYCDRQVWLDVWRVTDWEGEPRALEGQPLRWVTTGNLGQLVFPAADAPVLSALALPERYLITPAPGDDVERWLDALADAAKRHACLVQIRAAGLSRSRYEEVASRAIARVRDANADARVLLNAAPELVRSLGADGVHLNARRLMSLAKRPIGAGTLVAASCHDAAELAQAAAIGVDFAVLGPVRVTASHPGATR